MALSYNVEVLEKFKALAIQHPGQLVPGKTFYSNGYPAEFTVTRLLTEAEHDVAFGLSESSRVRSADTIELRWFGYMVDGFNGEKHESYVSMWDRNIGQSYNPWLIFADKETLEACNKELIVTHYTSEKDKRWEEMNDSYMDTYPYDEYPDEPIDPLEDADGLDDSDRQTEHELYEKGWR
jgi:hypothetical protein